MLTSTTLVSESEFTVNVTVCSEHRAHWTPPEPVQRFGVVLPRSGHFRLASDGIERTVDVTRGYLQVPGHEQRFAHPAGGDVCTHIALSPALWDDLIGDHLPTSHVEIDARTELAHRMLLSAERNGADPAELVVHTVDSATTGTRADRFSPSARSASRARLAAAAREAVLAEDPAAADLLNLARCLRASPSHLSRVFREHNGTSLTAFRNRIRISRVFDRLEGGDRNLAAIAADVGFADQAHLTRAVRTAVGTTPGRLREVLATSAVPDSRAGRADDGVDHGRREPLRPGPGRLLNR